MGRHHGWDPQAQVGCAPQENTCGVGQVTNGCVWAPAGLLWEQSLKKERCPPSPADGRTNGPTPSVGTSPRFRITKTPGVSGKSNSRKN